MILFWVRVELGKSYGHPRKTRAEGLSSPRNARKIGQQIVSAVFSFLLMFNVNDLKAISTG